MIKILLNNNLYNKHFYFDSIFRQFCIVLLCTMKFDLYSIHIISNKRKYNIFSLVNKLFLST